MRRTYERGTTSRLSFSCGPHAPVNMADSMEEVSVDGKKCRKWPVCCVVLRCISYAKFSQILEVVRDFYRLFGSRNSPTTGILHTMRHVYRSMCPAREAKPRFGAAFERSARDCETPSLGNRVTPWAQDTRSHKITQDKHSLTLVKLVPEQYKMTDWMCEGRPSQKRYPRKDLIRHTYMLQC